MEAKKTVKVLVSKPKDTKKTFCAEAYEDIDGEHLYGLGTSVKGAIEDLYSLLSDVNEFRNEDGKAALNVKFEFVFDVAAMFNYYSYLDISSVATRLGINPGLMRKYASGVVSPGAKRYQDISAGMKEIASEINKIKFCI